MITTTTSKITSTLILMLQGSIALITIKVITQIRTGTTILSITMHQNTKDHLANLRTSMSQQVNENTTPSTIILVTTTLVITIPKTIMPNINNLLKITPAIITPSIIIQAIITLVIIMPVIIRIIIILAIITLAVITLATRRRVCLVKAIFN